VNIIAIETATDVCGVALFMGGKLVDIVEEKSPREHAKKLPIHFLELQKKTKYTLNDIDVIAISIGPGSFTGLRIGLSFAKGLAYSHGLPIIPVPTLHSLAHGYNNEAYKNLLVLLHSHKNSLFIQNFQHLGESMTSVENPVATTYDQLAIENTENVIHYNCAEYLNINDMIEVPPSAKLVGECAVQHFEEWKIDDPKELVPDYISPFNLGKVKK